MPRRGLVVPARLRAPAALWALFAVETAVVARWPRLLLDTAVDDLVGRLRATLEPGIPGLRTVAGTAARLGAREVLVPLALGFGIVVSRQRRALRPLARLAGSYLLVAGVTGLTKAGLARPQPLPLAGVPGRAFPSGHVAQAVVVFGIAALLVGAGRAPEWRRRAFMAVAALVGTVGLALLWRQAHWLTDLVGGATLGLACLTTVDAAVDATSGRRATAHFPAARR